MKGTRGRCGGAIADKDALHSPRLELFTEDGGLG